MEDRASGEGRFRRAFRLAPAAMALCSVHGTIEEANDELARLLGLSVDDLVSRSVFDPIHTEDLPAARSAFARMLGTAGAVTWQGIRLRHADGRVLHTVVSSSGVDDPDGNIGYLVMHVEDVTHRVSLEAALQRQALHDPLTDLPNRALFEQRLTDVSVQAVQARVGVLFVDLDRFKMINDNHGHVVGDAVLIAVAGRLRALLRPGDTVARFGGDEFVLLCQNVDLTDATRIAERITAAIEGEITVGKLRLTVTASIGIAVRRRDDNPPEWLIRQADMAMYRAKAAGRARIEAFPPETSNTPT